MYSNKENIPPGRYGGSNIPRPKTSYSQTAPHRVTNPVTPAVAGNASNALMGSRWSTKDAGASKRKDAIGTFQPELALETVVEEKIVEEKTRTSKTSKTTINRTYASPSPPSFGTSSIFAGRSGIPAPVPSSASSAWERIKAKPARCPPSGAGNCNRSKRPNTPQPGTVGLTKPNASTARATTPSSIPAIQRLKASVPGAPRIDSRAGTRSQKSGTRRPETPNPAIISAIDASPATRSMTPMPGNQRPNTGVPKGNPKAAIHFWPGTVFRSIQIGVLVEHSGNVNRVPSASEEILVGSDGVKYLKKDRLYIVLAENDINQCMTCVRITTHGGKGLKGRSRDSLRNHMVINLAIETEAPTRNRILWTVIGEKHRNGERRRGPLKREACVDLVQTEEIPYSRENMQYVEELTDRSLEVLKDAYCRNTMARMGRKPEDFCVW